MNESSIKTFISYARADSAFAERLRDRLIDADVDAYLDKHDISPGEDWRGRLGRLIETADAILFVISPDSVRSEICDWEVNRAERLNKRVLPVVCRATADAEIPQRLARLSYVFMRSEAEERDAWPGLLEALKVAIEWVRLHTRFGERALEWDRSGRPSSLLLRGRTIERAEAWRDERPSHAPQLTELHSAHIAQSRRAATRRQRLWIAGSSAVAAVTAALAVVAFLQQQAAVASRRQAVQTLATSDFRQGAQALNERETVDAGLAWLARAARDGHNRRALTRLWTFFQQRSFWIPLGTAEGTQSAASQPNPRREATDEEPVPRDIAQRFARHTINGKTFETKSMAISPDGSRVLTKVGDPALDATDVYVRVWTRDGEPVTDWIEPAYQGSRYIAGVSGHFSPGGRFLALEIHGWRERSHLQIIDLATGNSLTTDDQVGDAIWADGRQPQGQFAGFSQVRFIQLPDSTDDEPRLLLLTAAQKGDAAAFSIFGDFMWQIARHRHREAATVITVDPEHEWLMSGAVDGTVFVTSIAEDTHGRSVGGILRFDHTPTELRRVDDSELRVRTDDGSRHRFRLHQPITLPVGSAGHLLEPSTHCLNSLDHGLGDEDTILSHPSGHRLRVVGPRRLVVEAQGNPDESVRSPLFSSDITLACLDRAGEKVIVTSDDFVTQIWDRAFENQHGPALDEKPFFGLGETPEQAISAQLTESGEKALVTSYFRNPPNLDYRWFTLWDTGTGVLLMDRVRTVEDYAGRSVATHASIGADDDVLVFSSEDTGGALEPLFQLHIDPPDDVVGWLADFAEAVGGVALGELGIPLAVPNRRAAIHEGLERFGAALKNHQ